ncbi:DUF3307 domain-containing protein [candidate division KSB1 bacterium]|nr:DUF3307 domain-containing protein [candidate division KSB1 bacterium]
MADKLFIVLLTAHLLTDYIFQHSEMVQQKKRKRFSSFINHVCIYIITAFLLSVNWLSWKLVFVILLQAVLHLILDYIKVLLELKHPQLKLEIDLVDLLLHVAIIWFTVTLWTPVYSDIKVPFNMSIPLIYYIRFCVFLSAIVLLTRGSTFFVRAVLGKVRTEKQLQADRTGRLIGNIERLLIFIFVLCNSPAAIGFIITAKSIARFEEIKEKRFAEYYIIGTLTSTLIAIIVGKVVVFILNSDFLSQ